MSTMRRRKGSSMRRTLGILQAVAAAERPITPTELNVGLGLPKPTIHRLCNMLVDEGFLQNSLHGKGLTAGLKLRQLAIDVVAHGGGRRAALHAILEAVAETVGETCNINVPDGNAMRYVDRVESRWPLRLQLPIGSRVPLHCTASGKAFLGSLPPARRRQVITNLALDRHTPNTITDRGTLGRAIERVVQNGYGTDDGEFLEGMVAVAVPIQDPRRRLIATLAMHGPTQRLSLGSAIERLPALREAADRLARLFEDE